MKLEDLEAHVLVALDRLRAAETAAVCNDTLSHTKPEDISFLRLRCEATERRYSEALEALGFGFALQELSVDPVGCYSQATKPTHKLILGLSGVASSEPSRDNSDHASQSTIVSYPLMDEDWLRERKKLEMLMMSLREVEAQDPHVLLGLRAEMEELLASISYKRGQAETICSETFSAYRNALNRSARLLIEIEGLYMELDQVNAATELDLKATSKLRSEIMRRSH